MTAVDRHLAGSGYPPAGAWYLYEFTTDLRCALGCPPGAHPLYVGKSNEPLRRLVEHAKDKPWFGYVTGWSVVPGVWPSDGAVLVAERDRIRASLPLANEQHNLGNPHRLDFGSLVAPVQVPRPVHQPSRPWRWPVLLRSRAFWLTLTWLVLAMSGWVVVHHVVPRLPWRTDAAAGGVGASLLLWWLRPRRRRRRRGRSRRGRR